MSTLTPSEEAPLFPWRSLLFAEAVVLVAAAFGAWNAWKIQHDATLPAAFGVASLSLMAFLAHRYTRLRADVAAGTFSLEGYRENPTRYFMGPSDIVTLWIKRTLIVILVVLAAGTFLTRWLKA